MLSACGCALENKARNNNKRINILLLPGPFSSHSPEASVDIAGLCCALAESLDGQLVRPDGQSPSRKSSSRALSREDSWEDRAV
jgi:hypothetical protein